MPGPELVALHERLLAPAPVRPAQPKGLLERDDELAAIAAALHRLAAGEGGVLAFEGPAGIGKTRLLGVLRERAQDGGAEVLDARAGLLEREYGFGVVRQLFEAMTAGDPPPPGARSVFGEGVPADGLFATLNALFHYTATLATRRPLVLCIDDLQWSDTASLRFVAYLARRIADLPVLVATTIRTGEPDSDELLLGELGQDPSTVAVAAQAADRRRHGRAGQRAPRRGRRRVRRRLPGRHRRQSAAAAPAADGAGRRARRARRRSTPPRCARSGRARCRAPCCCGSAGCPAPAPAVARAVAVLGEQPGLPAIAGLAETDEAGAADAIEALVAGGDPALRGAARLRPPARARRDLRRAAGAAARRRARPRRAAARRSGRQPGADRRAADAGAAARRRVGRRAAARGGGDRDRARRPGRRARAPPARAGRAARARGALGADARARRGRGVRARDRGGRGARAGARRAHRPGRARDDRGDARAHAAVHGAPGRGDGRRRRGARGAARRPGRHRPRAARDPDRRRLLRRRRPREPGRAGRLAPPVRAATGRAPRR